MRRTFRTLVYVSCWHLNQYESAAMWKLYSQSSDAVAIQTTYTRLASLLPSWVHMGLIDYIDYEIDKIADKNLFPFVMHKRSSFQHEHEVRAVVWDALGDTVGDREIRAAMDSGGLKISIDLSALIECVYVSPTSPEWFKDVVAKLTGKYPVDAPVRQSNLLAPPRY